MTRLAVMHHRTKLTGYSSPELKQLLHCLSELREQHRRARIGELTGFRHVVAMHPAEMRLLPFLRFRCAEAHFAGCASIETTAMTFDLCKY
jgi:hypothetical protein